VRLIVTTIVCALSAPLGFASEDPDTVTIAFAAEATQVDPTRTMAGVDGYFMDLFFERLLTVTAELERVNWLAESWEVIEEEGETRIDVALKRGIKFHDGVELTAGDFRFAYERQSDPASGVSSRLRYVTDVVVHDDYHLTMHLSQPDGSLIVQNLDLWAIPKHYYEQVGEAGVQAHPIGTGPWKFVSRKPRDELVVERFDDYWNQDALPGYKRLVIKIIPEDTTRVAAYKTGAVDWIDAVPPAQAADFRELANTHVTVLQAPNNLFLSLNEIDPSSPFRDPRVRQAIAYGVDYDAIIKYILFGQGIRTAQLAPGSLGYDPELEPYPYDPEKARALLQEAGYPAGINIPCYNLTTPREPYIKEIGETIFAYLAEVGIRCRIVQMEYGAWITLARYQTRPWMDGLNSTMWGQGLPGDPTDAWGGHLHTHGDGWGTYSYASDPGLDKMIEDLRQLMDDREREALIKKIARLKHERMTGGVPTYRPLLTFAWRDTIDFKPNPGAFWRSMRAIGPCPSRNCAPD
jgi:peptide/nickel transport system substrate-binding protein